MANKNARSRELDRLLAYAAPDNASRAAVLRRYLGEELPKMATDDTLYFDKGLLEIIVEAMPKTHAVLDATKRAP